MQVLLVKFWLFFVTLMEKYCPCSCCYCYCCCCCIGIRANASVSVTEEDHDAGPLSSVATQETDYMLGLAWAFVLVCSLVGVFRSAVGLRVWNTLTAIGRHEERQIPHLDWFLYMSLFILILPVYEARMAVNPIKYLSHVHLSNRFDNSNRFHLYQFLSNFLSVISEIYFNSQIKRGLTANRAWQVADSVKRW